MPRFYDATGYLSKPVQDHAVFAPVSGIYERGIWAGDDFSAAPDKATVQNSVRQAKHRKVWFNIESLPITLAGDTDFSQGWAGMTTQANIERCADVLRWAKEARPDKEYGIYACPQICYRESFRYPWYAPKIAESLYAIWRIGQDRAGNGDAIKPGGIVAAADFLAPDLYHHGETVEEYTRWVRDMLIAFKQHGKPVHPFLKVTNVTRETVSHLIAAVMVCRKLDCTPILWGGWDEVANDKWLPWTADMPWLAVFDEGRA